MRRFCIPIVLALLLAACATGGGRDNTFVINGRQVVFSDAQMVQVRSMWSDAAPYARFQTGLTDAEARWAADFIAVQERARSAERICDRLQLLSVSPSPPGVQDMLGRQHAAGTLKLDRLWVIDACGTRRAYRVFQPANALALAIFEVRI